jgi:hypothetical protein
MKFSISSGYQPSTHTSPPASLSGLIWESWANTRADMENVMPQDVDIWMEIPIQHDVYIWANYSVSSYLNFIPICWNVLIWLKYYCMHNKKIMTWNFPYRPGINLRPIPALQLRCRAWYGSLGLTPIAKKIFELTNCENKSLRELPLFNLQLFLFRVWFQNYTKQCRSISVCTLMMTCWIGISIQMSTSWVDFTNSF